MEERSNGEIKVEIYPDNQLGNERDVIEGMQLGTVEMAMTSVVPFSSVVPSVNIFCLPFLWRDKEHMYSVLDLTRLECPIAVTVRRKASI